MNICTNNSTPKHGLSATKQATRESGDSRKFLQIKDSCPNCGSTNLLTGAGLKPGQMSLNCSECNAFIGYKNLEKLKRLRKRKQLTDCIELLEQLGIQSVEATTFILSLVGGES